MDRFLLKCGTILKDIIKSPIKQYPTGGKQINIMFISKMIKLVWSL